VPPCTTIYYLIWLDSNAKNDQRTQAEFKSIIPCQLLTFNNVDSCEEYVLINPNDRFIFIVSDELGSTITPRIISLKQTITILVYSESNIAKTKRSWTDQYLTVRVVCQILLRQNKFIFPFAACSTSCDRSSNIENGSSIRIS
jgi:hypothetical protein